MSKSVGLVSCGKNKRLESNIAKDLYIGELFKKARRYSEKHHDNWFILSALHGLVDPNIQLDPYEYTLNKASKDEIVKWSEKVSTELINTIDIDTTVYVYAGANYRKYLLPILVDHGYRVEVPLVGLGIGQQLAWFKNNIGE